MPQYRTSGPPLWSITMISNKSDINGKTNSDTYPFTHKISRDKSFNTV